MMKNGYRALSLIALGAMVGSAHAVTFSNILINGVAASGNPFGPDGLSFSLPGNFLVGVGTKTTTIQYDVTADAGQVLTGFSMFNVGTVQNGTVSVTADHVNGGTQTISFSQTAGGTQQTLGNTSGPLVGHSSYSVLNTIVLSSNSPSGIVHLSTYDVSYSQAVPEPASMMALAIGVGALISKRRKGKRA